MLRLSSWLFVACFSLASHALAFTGSCENAPCVGVVDVGSTGTRLHVYARQQGAQKAFSEVWQHKITPGFSSIELKPETIYAYLDELFEGAPEELPVYFYATAGMRLLPADKQKLYYQAVDAWFEYKPWRLRAAKTITGQEEGVFAWLATRAHLKANGIEPPRYLSVMDMGGASVQVVTAVDDVTLTHDGPSDYIEVTIDNQKQSLFVHSFLGLGQQLLTQQLLDEPACFPKGYSMPNGGYGDGHAELCSDKASKLINGLHEVANTVRPALYQDEAQRTWYALGGLSYLAHSEPFSQGLDAFNNAWLISEAERAYCSQPWESVQARYAGQYGLSFICLMASSYHALMSQGYGLTLEEPVNFVPNAIDIDWTQGVLLTQD